MKKTVIRVRLLAKLKMGFYKLTDTSAIEGYGEVEEINGKMVFKDPTNLEYDKGLVLTKK